MSTATPLMRPPSSTAPPGVILVVDDTEGNRYVAARWLEQAGFRVATAATGAQALALAASDVELVLLDVHLPDLHGFEVARKLKADPRTSHIPVLHLSAQRVSSRDRASGLDAGADGYLAQPVEREELVANVRALLRLSETDRLLRERTIERERLLEESRRARRELEAVNLLLQEQQMELELTNQQLQDNTVELELQAEELQATAALLEERTEGAERAMRAAERAERQLQATFAQAPAAVAVTEGSGHRFVIVNDRYQRLVGRSVRVGQTFREALPEIAAQGYEAKLDQVFATGRPYAENDAHALVDKGGDAPEEGWYDFVYQPLLDAAGRVMGIMQHAVEVTAQARSRVAVETTAREREILLRESEQARAEAEAANRAKSEFLAVMSHELRTPLNAIAGYAELIAMGVRGPVTPEQALDLGRIQRSQRHLLGLINGVLNYARVEGGHVNYEIDDVVVDDVLATCEALVAPQVRAKRLTLTFTACETSLVARADGEKLQQVVLNLLSNAVKFTEPGGTIAMSCDEAGNLVRVRVRDTGRGIAADYLERVFAPFVQVDSQLTRTHEGTGLGLAISRDLARGMGGDLTVTSVVNEGSTFTLTLPRA